MCSIFGVPVQTFFSWSFNDPTYEAMPFLGIFFFPCPNVIVKWDKCVEDNLFGPTGTSIMPKTTWKNAAFFFYCFRFNRLKVIKLYSLLLLLKMVYIYSFYCLLWAKTFDYCLYYLLLFTVYACRVIAGHASFSPSRKALTKCSWLFIA